MSETNVTGLPAFMRPRTCWRNFSRSVSPKTLPQTAICAGCASMS
jgi:hypothetical protein